MNMDFEEIPLLVKSDYYIKETDKSYCFKLWGKKFQAFPKSQIKGYYTPEQTESDFYRIILPKWFVGKNNLQSLMEDAEQKERIFPPKRKKQAETPLFDTTAETTEVDCVTAHRPDWW